MRWEYASVTRKGESYVVTFNHSDEGPPREVLASLFETLAWLGNRGWEFILVDTTPKSPVYFLKRPISPLEPPRRA
jgi:hypothetical protein